MFNVKEKQDLKQFLWAHGTFSKLRRSYVASHIYCRNRFEIQANFKDSNIFWIKEFLVMGSASHGELIIAPDQETHGII